MTTTSPQSAAPPPGLRVGDYRLIAKIGEGGMGVVHLAQGSDGRRVALKVLRPHVIGDDEARERLAREVASLRRVRSPRVAEVLDADPWGPTPFVATRYVPGLSLHEHVREEGPLRGDDLRHAACALAEALLSVHAVGVLHRDVKPSNVLLEGRSPVLIDFGLARLAEDPRLTVTGWLLGTPGYLAPEILYGEDATPASDVHSWAATVAFAATGSPPFGKGPAMAIMDRVRRGEHDLSGVPADLRPLLVAALGPDPASRPGLPELLADLRPVPPAPRSAGPVDQPTMPYALSLPPREDPDRTEVVGSDDPTDRHAQDGPTRIAPTALATAPTPPTTPTTPTTPYTSVGHAARAPYQQPAPPTTPYTSHVHTPARTPYQQPSPPPASPGTGQPAVPAPAWQPPPGGAARLQRGLLLAGSFAAVTVGFGLAPYLTLGLLALLALAVRTWSWTSESARDRVWRRGRRRWYDGPLAVVSSPWYLLVAAGGTLVLMLWSAALTLLVGLGLLLFAAPVVGGLLVMGAVLAFTTWWGPGARRLRVPTRRLVLLTTRNPWSGWGAVAVLGAVVVTAAYLLSVHGVVWDPQPGPPWRPGTLLGDLAGYL